MIDIIAFCTYDARKLAAELVRRLEAEQYHVRLAFGRQVLGEIADAKTAHAAVMMIWSEDAPSQSYMRECLRQIEASRLVEIATAPGWPARKDRKAAVIDFATWRGERGGRAWSALNDRLRAVANVLDPPKPPPLHAAAVLGFASVAVVGIAMGVRFNENAPVTTVQAPETQQTAQLDAPMHSVGGAIIAIEPASVDDLAAPPLRPLRVQMLSPSPPLEFVEYNPQPIPEVRDPTLFERLREFNPLSLVAGEEEEPPTAD